jgi:hypothetical protein
MKRTDKFFLVVGPDDTAAAGEIQRLENTGVWNRRCDQGRVNRKRHSLKPWAVEFCSRDHLTELELVARVLNRRCIVVQ